MYQMLRPKNIFAPLIRRPKFSLSRAFYKYSSSAARSVTLSDRPVTAISPSRCIAANSRDSDGRVTANLAAKASRGSDDAAPDNSR